jgi:hypothetical protein
MTGTDREAKQRARAGSNEIQDALHSCISAAG